MTSESIIEAVARAICPDVKPWLDAPEVEPSACACEGIVGDSVTACFSVNRQIARAAILAFLKAIEEPSEGMVQAYYAASCIAAKEDFDLDAPPFEELKPDQVERLYQFGRAMLSTLAKEIEHG